VLSLILKNVFFHTLLALTILLLLSLGAWQVRRLGWKEGLIAAQEKSLAQPPRTLPMLETVPEAAQPFQPVRLTGALVWQKALWFGPRTLENGDIGYHLVLPLRLADKANPYYHQRYVLVKMGVVSETTRNKWRRPSTEEEVTLNAITLPNQLPGWRMAVNHPEKNFWQLLYVDQMASALSLKPFYPLPVQAYAPPGTEWPYPMITPLPRRFPLRNEHRAYALTWFFLAGILIFLWGRWHWKHQTVR
jgi:surfeit locus 1 family protein